MARLRITDHMQAYPFWLVDIQPNLYFPFFALNPLMGFQSCGAVEITHAHTAYRPIDRMFPVHMPEAASVGPITLRRGAMLGVADYYRWMDRHIRGEDRSRRNLLMVHFLTRGIQGIGGLELVPGLTIGGPFSEVIRPPGRAWVLWDCVPIRYSSGELDATSGQVVIHELEIQPGAVTQVDLGIV